jgi:hypothetical protein
MLETKVVVEVAGQVLLNAEKELLPLLRDDSARWFRGFGEVAFLAVFLERHASIMPPTRLPIAGWFG